MDDFEDFTNLTDDEAESMLVAMMGRSVQFWLGPVQVNVVTGDVLQELVLIDLMDRPDVSRALQGLLPGAEVHGRWQSIQIGDTNLRLLLRLVIDADTTIRLELQLNSADVVPTATEIRALMAATRFMLVCPDVPSVNQPTVPAPDDRGPLRAILDWGGSGRIGRSTGTSSRRAGPGSPRY